MTRWGFAALGFTVILAGLLLRLPPWGLPLWVHHFGGGLLWGAMVFLLVEAFRPPRWGRMATLAAATSLAVALELSRLYHTPALDTFRATLAGQLLLGRIFSAWNILAYGAGIAMAAAATRRAAKAEHSSIAADRE